MMKQGKHDNRGIALVSVLIVITLCLLLSGAIMQVSYMALLSRNVSTASANNFYDAESVVDDMKIELQTVAAAALNVAGSKNTQAYIDQVYNVLTTGSSSNQLENVQENLAKYADLPGATITLDAAKSAIEKGTDYVCIKGVTVEYTDPNTGYYSKITTDIKVRAPYYASSEKKSLGSYSSLVGSGAELYSEESYQNNKPGYMLQEGNAYFGTMKGSSLSLLLRNYVTLEFEGDNVVINGDIYVHDHSTLKFTGSGAVEVRGTIYLDEFSHLIVGSDTYLLCKDIVVDGAYVAGNTKNGYYSYKNYSLTFVNEPISKQYNNVVSGTAYSQYFPYQNDPYNNFKEELVPGIKDEWTWNGSASVKTGGLPSSIMVLDKKDNKCYALMNQGTEFSYQRAGGSEEVKFELISNTSNPSGNQGIYLDATVSAHAKIPFTAYDKQNYQVDDKVYEFLNVAYLTYISKDSNSRQIRRMVSSYEKRPVSSVNDPLGLAACKTINPNTDLYCPTSPIKDSVELELEYQGKKYTGAIQNDDGCVFGKSQDSYNPNQSAFLSMFFCVNPYTVEFNKGTDYLGIFMSLDRVTYKVKWGSVKGRSILSSTNEQDIENAKKFVEKLSYYVIGQDKPSDKEAYAWLVNNMFNGGWESLFEGGDSSTTVDTSQNENLDLIELENWNKH